MSADLATSYRIKRKINVEFRKITSCLRLTPSFVIFAAPRCGTTSMYSHLSQHPSIGSALFKEIGFFEFNYKKGLDWYKMYFPLAADKYKIKKPFRKYFLTGEATSNYIHHPKVPERIKKDFPNIKLIAMLRNPVDRAFSQWYKQVKQDRENLSFEEAIEKEEERIRGETEKMMESLDYYSIDYHNYSYLEAGKYFDRLKIWFETFPREQILVIKSEDFYKDPNNMYKKTLKFLELPDYELKTYSKENYFKDKPKLNNSTREKLSEYFKPHNEKLYNLIDRDMEWK